MAVTIYGIKNCDTMKKAFTWLGEHDEAYDFHDYKKQGVTKEKLREWCAKAGWEKVINRAGTTFKKLADEEKQDLDEARAIALMVNQPSMIKRPVIEKDGRVEIGFKPDAYAAFFAS